MKEIDLKTLQTFFQKEIEAINLRYVIIFIALNLFIAFINWLIQRNVKNLEKEIYKKKVREDKRITVIENIYKELVFFTYAFSPTELNDAFPRLSTIEREIADNKLYIDNKLHNKLIEFTDYIKDINVDFRKKDLKCEMKLLKGIETEFNK